ncbi:hypothetical protein IWW38_001617, partial [Coemansia aciculifera]
NAETFDYPIMHLDIPAVAVFSKHIVFMPASYSKLQYVHVSKPMVVKLGLLTTFTQYLQFASSIGTGTSVRKISELRNKKLDLGMFGAYTNIQVLLMHKTHLML